MFRVFLLCIFLYLSLVYSNDCQYTTPDGMWTYDLTNFGMIGPYISTNELGTRNRTYYIHQPCSDIVNFTEYETAFPSACNESSVCIESSDGEYFSGGYTRNSKWEDSETPDQGFIITYQGDICEDAYLLRMTTIQFVCYLPQDAPTELRRREVDPLSAYTYISNVDDSNQCHTIITVFSPLGCPSNRPADPTCAGLNEEDCLAVDNCYCGFCDGHCVAYYEECTSEREFDCHPPAESGVEDTLAYLGFDAVLLGLCITGVIISIVSCCLACFLRRPGAYKTQVQKDNVKPTPRKAKSTTHQPFTVHLDGIYFPLSKYPNQLVDVI